MSESSFFSSAAELREWFAAHHGDASELWIGFFKKGAGKGGATYAEALDEALCVGWIDGLTRRIDEERYTIRFTPRKPRSIWSQVNIARVAELTAQGRMLPAGLATFAGRDPARERQYSFEQGEIDLDPEAAARFRAHPAAWAFFERQPPSYRKPAIWWVISAKRAETRERRLAKLIEDSASERRLAHLTSTPKQG